jgi:hypothetical protein
VQAYRRRHLVADDRRADRHVGGRVEALVRARLGRRDRVEPRGAAIPGRLARLVIVNAPHPATFLRALQHDPRSRPPAPT